MSIVNKFKKQFQESDIRATLLTGLSLATATAITATDSILSAFGKIQAQINDLMADDISMDIIGAPSYETLQDWSNAMQSSGVISGGVITSDGSGGANISEIQGIIKKTDSDTGENAFFRLSEQTSISLTDNSINYIAVDYNAGTPQIAIATTNTANGHTIFNLGKAYREGTKIDIINSGLNIYDIAKRIQQHHLEQSALHFTSGARVSETGTRNISLTPGVMYAGLNRILTDAIDTSVADDFEYYYYNGAAWLETDSTQINNTQYNDIATGLATLSNNRYGVHWIYKGTNASTYIVYGQDSYTLSEAQTAQPPASLPSHVSEMGVLRAKIIIAKNATTFTEIEPVDDIQFTGSTAGSHLDLTDIGTQTHAELETAISGKEPSFVKNSAFNKNFGTTSGTVTEGDKAVLLAGRSGTQTINSPISLLNSAIDSGGYGLILGYSSSFYNGFTNYFSGTAASNYLAFMVNTGTGTRAEMMRVLGNGNVGIGLTPTANMPGLSIETGCLTLKERTTPTADSGYVKIYSKSDNKLYFQSGDGVEHEVVLA